MIVLDSSQILPADSVHPCVACR